MLIENINEFCSGEISINFHKKSRPRSDKTGPTIQSPSELYSLQNEKFMKINVLSVTRNLGAKEQVSVETL